MSIHHTEAALTVVDGREQLPVIAGDPLEAIGEIADQVASQGIFQDYREQCTANTLRRQKSDLAVFVRYLQEAGIERSVDALLTRAEAWQGMTYGIVKAFVKWQSQQGYSIGSINVRLATVKTYCSLAAEAKMIPAGKLDLIKTVKGYGHKKGRNLDKTRQVTRLGEKKAAATSINGGQASLLKKQPETDLGKRDALLMCLLLDLGLRCGEVAGLLMQDIDLVTGTITFYREKVDLEQTHALTPDTLIAAMAYLALPHVEQREKLFPGYKGKGLSTRAINSRVRELGRAIGIETLSPHDCRHYWATVAMRNKTDIKALQTAGGWKSPAMPLRYAEASTIANEGVRLG